MLTITVFQSRLRIWAICTAEIRPMLNKFCTVYISARKVDGNIKKY